MPRKLTTREARRINKLRKTHGSRPLTRQARRLSKLRKTHGAGPGRPAGSLEWTRYPWRYHDAGAGDPVARA